MQDTVLISVALPGDTRPAADVILRHMVKASLETLVRALFVIQIVERWPEVATVGDVYQPRRVIPGTKDQLYTSWLAGTVRCLQILFTFVLGPLEALLNGFVGREHGCCHEDQI